MKRQDRPSVVLALDALHARRAGGTYAHTFATEIEHGPRAGLWFSMCPRCGDCLHFGERAAAEVFVCHAGCHPDAIRERMVSELTRTGARA